jgi:hypothetical protein
MSNTYYGFGYDPKESENHFYVVVPKEATAEVEIYERFHWDTLSLHDALPIWLKADKKPTGRFIVGETAVEKLFGKELMVLLWGVENNDPAGIPTAIRNWKGLQPEERWWLYTMTNASTGKINDKRGWRMALRYALCENPVDESNQISLFTDLMGGE